MKYFEVVVQVRHESEDSKGNVKVKKVSEIYLVDAMTITEAEARVVKHLSGLRDFEVVQAKSSKILEVVSVEVKESKPKVNNSKELPIEKDDDLSELI